jgi:hypothetical protein
MGKIGNLLSYQNDEEATYPAEPAGFGGITSDILKSSSGCGLKNILWINTEEADREDLPTSIVLGEVR